MNIAEFGKSQSWCVTFPWVTETSEDQAENWKHQIRIYKENCTKYMFVWIMSSMQTPYDWTAGLLSYTGWFVVQISCICQVIALFAMSILISNLRVSPGLGTPKPLLANYNFSPTCVRSCTRTWRSLQKFCPPQGKVDWVIAPLFKQHFKLISDFSLNFAWFRNYWKGRC